MPKKDRPTRQQAPVMASHGHFYWNELMTRDAERAKKFYHDTIGWTFDAMRHPRGTYWVAKLAGQPVAGILPMSGAEFDGVAEQWMAYVAVDDVDARVKRATAAGATLIRAPFDVPTVGRIAIVREPGGAVIAWMTPAGS